MIVLNNRLGAVLAFGEKLYPGLNVIPDTEKKESEKFLFDNEILEEIDVQKKSENAQINLLKHINTNSVCDAVEKLVQSKRVKEALSVRRKEILNIISDIEEKKKQSRKDVEENS